MKKTILAILAAAIALSLMLTACSKGGETSGDNSTGGTSSTAGTTSGNADSTTPNNKDGKPVYPNMPTDYSFLEIFEPLDNSQEGKDMINAVNEALSRVIKIEVAPVIDGAIQKYGKYFLDYIPAHALMPAVCWIGGEKVQSENNVTGITDNALAKANKFLKENGIEELDGTDPEQNIAALAVAAMLLFEKDASGGPNCVYDLANACCEDVPDRKTIYIGTLSSTYHNLI